MTEVIVRYKNKTPKKITLGELETGQLAYKCLNCHPRPVVMRLHCVIGSGNPIGVDLATGGVIYDMDMEVDPIPDCNIVIEVN